MRAFTPKAAILGLSLAGTALAQASSGPVPAVAAAPAGQSLRSDGDATGAPTPDVAVATYFDARRWLDAGGTGPDVATPPSVRSAAVVLRLRGRIVGVGEALGGDGAPAPVQRALREAMDDARSRRGAAVGGSTIDLARSVTLELELAGPREPLIGRTFDEVARSIEPGECGLVMVDGTRTSYEPASVLLARRMASPVSRAVLAMVSDLGLPPRDLPELQELGGSTAIYASHGIRLAQTTPSGTPFVLARTLPAVASEEARAGEAARLAAGVIARLAAQLDAPARAEGLPADAIAQMARAGLRGDYTVAADRYEPFAAGPAEQALSAWALARASQVAAWPEPVRAQARNASAMVVDALREIDPTERDPSAEPAAVAYAVLAAADLGQPSALAYADALVPTLRSLTAPAALASVRPHVRAALLDAAAARRGSTTEVASRDQLDRMLADCLRDTPTAELPLVAPLAFDALRRLHGNDWASVAVLAEERARIEAARTVLLATQVQPDAGARPASLDDMAGAFPMAGATTGRISAQSLRAQLFVALVAGQPAWRTGSRDAEDRRSLRWAIRFVDQLAAPVSIAYCAPAPERTVGGILASPADASQPAAAQAVAILALVESEDALRRLGSAPPRQSGPNP